MTDKKSITEFADARAGAVHAENEEIARANRVLRTEIAGERAKTAAALAERDANEVALRLYRHDYSTQPEWARPPRSKHAEDHGTLVAMLSDTHYGEMVSAREMAGTNKYDLVIAEARTERFFRRTVRVARDYFAGVKYDGIVLALGGDIVSGDIHDELVQTNETSTYETVLWAVPRLAAGIEMWAKEFGHVHVVSAPGNHGRNSQKPRYKRRSANNADTLIAHLVARQFKGDARCSFDIPESLDVDFKVYGSRFTMEHGDELNAFGGSAEIGPLGPLVRGTNRKANAAATEGRPFDYALWGHLHQYIPASSRGFIANGSLKGPDEYSRGKKFKPEPAQQALMVVTANLGITTQMPIHVSDRVAEKW